MLTRGKVAATVGATLVFLVAAPSALATDASIRAAWNAGDSQFVKLGRQERKAIAAWERSGFKDSGPVLAIESAARKLLAANTRAVTAQAESSPTGARAKRYVLAANKSFDSSLAKAQRGIGLTTAGRRSAGKRAFAQADRYGARSKREAKAAKKLFRQVL